MQLKLKGGVFVLQTYAMQQVLAKFGILQVARTGKISLKRGEELLEMGGWGDGRRKSQPQRAVAEKATDSASRSQNNGAVVEEQQEGGSDVYAVDNKQTGQCLSASPHLILADCKADDNYTKGE